MKVLFLCPSLVGAGVERRVCTLLKALCRQDLDVRLGLLRGEGEFLYEVPETRLVLEPADFRLKRLLERILRSPDLVNCLLGIFQIRAMMRKIEPDVVVSFTLETTIPGYFAIRNRYAERIAWMISEDSNTAAATDEIFDSVLTRRLVRAFLGKIYRKAGHVCCVSRSVANTVAEVYRVDNQRLSSLANPVDVARVEKASDDRTNSRLPSRFILAVGRLVRIKQFDLLINAFAEVRKSRPIQLLILGEGSERENLSRLIVEQGLQDDVRLPGFVENPWHYMGQAEMLVLTSKLEGFGNVIVEAMAAGCPVIATRCGGPEDVIQHGYNGLLVEQNALKIAEAIGTLLNEPAFSATLVKNARTTVTEYGADKISARFGAILNQLATQRVR